MRQFLDDLHVPHTLDAPLAPETWYGVGGPAAVLARPSSAQQLAALAARAHEQGLPVHVLGSGANLLVADAGVPGLVVKLSDACFRRVEINGNIVTAGAGADLAKLVLQTAKTGLSGLECIAGVPASIGGAVRMNAGGRFGDIGRVVRRVKVMDSSGHVYYRDREDLAFSYRKSSIVAKFILEAELELTPDDPDALMQEVKRIFMLKSESQPLGDHSAGCAFKNPSPGPDGSPRSAGKLLDQAGLKGFRVGGAEVSPQHANFTVAHPGCTAADILAVLDHAQRVVFEKFGVKLEREVVVWP
ncbi:MAG: UDP-N-acetylmuramate dehydrogenase [Planctomycetota bacterium]|nr:UDP-N-acetylmuramate dehydrogenase [Planctomycetota bacterium]